MKVGRKPKKVELTLEQYESLRMRVVAGKTEQRAALRARVILLASEGKSLKEISSLTGLSYQNCCKWRKRFFTSGLEGLNDKRGRGRKPSIPPEKKVSVIALACSKPPAGRTSWSISMLAEEVGISRYSVHKVLNEGQLKPHKVSYWCGKSRDPEFEEKKTAIIGLYMNPPENALVLAVDEKSQIQALDRTQPELPMRAGSSKRLTATYKRHGTTCLLAALAVHDGNLDGRLVERHTHKEFLAFLKHLYRKHPRRQLHVILDNFSAHKHSKVVEWVGKRRRLTLHFTPTYSSWLNQVEIWFSIFSRDVLRGGVWHSKQALIKQIMKYIKHYNADRAKPFNWTYTGKPLVA